MIVPKFWAEASAKGVTARGRERTVRRLGWSDESEDKAREHALERACGAASQIGVRGVTVKPFEAGSPYLSGDEMPIREEVMARGEGWAITRNSYGSPCLNEESVLFADVDVSGVSESAPSWLSVLVFLALAVLVVSAVLKTAWLAASAAIALWCLSMFRTRQKKMTAKLDLERKESAVPANVEKEILARGWAGRLYKTPNGFRVMIVSCLADPKGDEVGNFFAAIGTDPHFARLCRVQGCFRARVGAKPWRAGVVAMPKKLRWPAPVDDEKKEWLNRYASADSKFAACRFVRQIGKAPAVSRAAETIERHDKMSKALTNLPLA